MRMHPAPVLLSMWLAACGGGGSSGSEDPPPSAREPLNFSAVYVVQDATGGGQVRLAGAGSALGPAAAGGVDRVVMTPDASAVLMLAREAAESPPALYRVDLAAPASRARLSPDGPAGHRGVDDVALSPDGTNVAFRGDLQTATLGQVFQVAVDGGAPARAIGVVIQTVDNELLGAATWSPDGRYFAYGKRSRVTGVRFAVLVKDGNASPPDPLTHDNPTDIREVHWTPDGSTQVYAKDDRSDGRYQLYRKPIGQPTETLLNAPLPDGSFVDRARVSSDGMHVAYRFSAGTTGGARLMLTDLDGGRQVIVAENPGLFEFSRDGQWLLFADAMGRLMRLPVSGPPSLPDVVSEPPDAGDHVLDLVPIDGAVVYRVGRLQGQEVMAARLLHATLAATPAVTPLSPATTGAGVQADFAIASDGRSVAYRADLQQAGQFELQASRLSEPGVAEALSGALAAGEQVTALALR